MGGSRASKTLRCSLEGFRRPSEPRLGVCEAGPSALPYHVGGSFCGRSAGREATHFWSGDFSNYDVRVFFMSASKLYLTLSLLHGKFMQQQSLRFRRDAMVRIVCLFLFTPLF